MRWKKYFWGCKQNKWSSLGEGCKGEFAPPSQSYLH